ncbi:DUF11 domain-containing protein [candidate division KSB1 bacterium]|nr:DUF11 domain-containing protein [candidate division KSB1 bacterium]
MKSNHQNIRIFRFFLIFLFSLCTVAFGQVQEIQDFLIVQDTLVVRADMGESEMHHVIKDTIIAIAGYYRIIPKILYNSGDEQRNESIYLSAVFEDGSVVIPLDANVGQYKLVMDDPGERHTAWRDGGLFRFQRGRYTLVFNHIAALADELGDAFYNYINESIHGPESVKLPDSVKILATPIVDGALELDAATLHLNDGKKIALGGESVQYTLTVKNLSENLMRFASLTNELPELFVDTQFSIEPQQQANNSITWDLPHITAGDSFVITMTATLPEEVPGGLTTLFDEAKLTVPNDNDSTNNLASETVFAFLDTTDQPELADVTISITSETGLSASIKGESFKYTRPESSLMYNILVRNLGPDTAKSLQVSCINSHNFELSTISINPYATYGDTIQWNFAFLNPSATLQIQFDGSVASTIASDDSLLIAKAMVSADNDTIPANNMDTDTVRVELESGKYDVDISISQYALTDSFVIKNGDMLKFARAGETYTHYVVVENSSNYDARNVKITDLFPDSVTVRNIQPVPKFSDTDSIFWSITRLAARTSRTMQFNATVPATMPYGMNYLINRAEGFAENEHPDKLGNNISIDTVYNAVIPPVDYQPYIIASPSIADVTDSIQVRVQIPKYTTVWDLWIYMPDGQANTSFGDEFIETTHLEPDTWYTVDELYRPFKLISSGRQEQLIFEIRTKDSLGDSDSARAVVQIQSSNYLVLDRNVYKPEVEQPLGIHFKLSYRRNARLDIYDIAGRHIVELTRDIYDGGWNTYPWNGMSNTGQRLGSGIYLVTLRTDEFNSWKKFLIVR